MYVYIYIYIYIYIYMIRTEKSGTYSETSRRNIV